MEGAIVATLASVEASASRAELAHWGVETLVRIRRDLYLPKSKLYAEMSEPNGRRDGPAFAASAAVMLSALTAASRIDRRYKMWLREYADSLKAYWRTDGPTPGFDVQPGPKPLERYYDDNAWLAMGYAETYSILGDRTYLARAEDALRFSLSGEDVRYTGGVWQREGDATLKTAGASGATACAAYRLAGITGSREYRVAADRIYDWTVSKLRDPFTGLYCASVDATGKVDRTLWSSDTALMIQGALSRGGDIGSLRDIALKHWAQPSGAISDAAQCAHVLFGAEYPERPKALLAVKALHEHGRDLLCHYGPRWDASVTAKWNPFRLIDQASAARAFFYAALHS